jgi:hypothetical protein
MSWMTNHQILILLLTRYFIWLLWRINAKELLKFFLKKMVAKSNMLEESVESSFNKFFKNIHWFFKQANHKEINDIDELNDETFGNLDGEDPNAWESFHFGVVNQNDDQKNENEPPNKLLSKFDSFTIKDLWDNNNPTVADVNLETSKIWSSSDILPPPKPQQNTTPKAITLEDLEKDLLMSSPTPPAAVGSSSHSPSHTHDHFSHTRTHPLPPSQVPYIGVPVPSRGGMYVRHPPPGP